MPMHFFMEFVNKATGLRLQIPIEESENERLQYLAVCTNFG